MAKKLYTTQFNWTIRNFATHASPSGPNAALMSEHFVINGTNARVQLVFCHTSLYSGDHCSLVLQVKHFDNKASGNAFAQVSISSTREQQMGQVDDLGHNLPLDSMQCVTFDNVFKRSDLCPSSSFLRDDTLVINCSIKYGADSAKKKSTSKDVLYSHKVLPGCVVVCGQDQFYAVKDRLVSISTRLKFMLEAKSEEARTGVIRLNEMDKRTFTAFKQFISDVLSSDTIHFEIADELSTLALDCGMDQLKVECKKRLLEFNDINGLAVCYKFGVLYADDVLKAYSLPELRMRFVGSTEIAYFKSDSWIEFSANKLRLALKIKIAVYKAIRILADNYSL